MTTPRDIWTQLLEEFPAPPSGPPLDEAIATTTTVAPATDADITNDIATTIYQGIASTPPIRTPSLYVTPSNGQELWISRGVANTGDPVSFHRVPQILQIHGPEYSTSTTDARRDVNGSATVDEAGQVVQFYKRPEYNQAYGNIQVRINYYPYYRAHSGIDGMLGYAKTGNPFYAAGVYRTYSEPDFPYLPGVIGEWIAVCYCTKFVIRSIGQLRIADFTLVFGSVPYLFHALDVPGEISAGRLPGATTEPAAQNLRLVELPTPGVINWPSRAPESMEILLDKVQLQSGGDAPGSWTYRLTGNLPRGTGYVAFNPTTRRFTLPSRVTGITRVGRRTAIPYELIYSAQQSGEPNIPPVASSRLTIRVTL